MSESRKIERRQYTRIDFAGKVTLRQGEARYASSLLDISLKGLLVSKPAQYQTNSTNPVDICLELTDETQIHMKTQLVHDSESVLGFKCEEIDSNSLSHLRRLIELNMDEPNAAERVLSELLNSIQ